MLEKSILYRSGLLTINVKPATISYQNIRRVTMGRPVKDITGNVYGNLTVLAFAGVDKRRNALFLCKCVCGKTITTTGISLKNGSTASCGCIKLRGRYDLIGKKFAQLTVLSIDHIDKWDTAHYLCQCDCGKKTIVGGNKLKIGHTRSCGCLKREAALKGSIAAVEVTATHRSSHSHLYGVWKQMRARCYRKATRFYNNYGGRGITVCDEWRYSFEAFRDWAIANGYKDSEGLSIDRIDVNGNYEPANCRWVTMKVQARNTRQNRLVTIGGETKCISEWAEIYNIKNTTIYGRINKGWDVIQAIITPPKGLINAG
jgi:hypothetical protein